MLTGRLTLLLAVLGLALGLWIGRGWGQGIRADEVASLSGKVGTLTGQLEVARQLNRGNAASLTSLRATLKAELDRRLAIERAAQEELASRAARIAQLERSADQRLETITRKAHEDEDCADLRHVPVCAAVAERLWGDAATARPH